MPTPSPLDHLHAHHAKLAERPPVVLTEDQRRSLVYYRSELAFTAPKPALPLSPVRVARWFLRLGELEAFVQSEGRWPRQYNRTSIAPSTNETVLATWVRTQRLAADRGRRCDYQTRRLACIPGFHRHPLDDAWIRNVIEYRQFTEAHSRAPRLRSDDPAEKRAAAFAAKQRLAYRRGQLSRDRIATLEQLEFWSWGSRPQS